MAEDFEELICFRFYGGFTLLLSFLSASGGREQANEKDSKMEHKYSVISINFHGFSYSVFLMNHKS